MARDHAVHCLLQCGKLGRCGNAIRADKCQQDHTLRKADADLACPRRKSVAFILLPPVCADAHGFLVNRGLFKKYGIPLPTGDMLLTYETTTVLG